MRLVVAVLIALTLAAPAFADTLPAPSAHLVRAWPRAGGWSTAMIRTSSHALACYTAAAPISSASRALPGLRIKGDDLAIEIADHDGRALAGDSIALFVDGAAVGRFAISERLHGFGVTTVLAEVPMDQRDAVMAEFQRGRTILFVTGRARYTASLAGTGAVTASLQACREGTRGFS